MSELRQPGEPTPIPHDYAQDFQYIQQRLGLSSPHPLPPVRVIHEPDLRSAGLYHAGRGDVTLNVAQCEARAALLYQLPNLGELAQDLEQYKSRGVENVGKRQNFDPHGVTELGLALFLHSSPDIETFEQWGESLEVSTARGILGHEYRHHAEVLDGLAPTIDNNIRNIALEARATASGWAVEDEPTVAFLLQLGESLPEVQLDLSDYLQHLAAHMSPLDSEYRGRAGQILALRRVIFNTLGDAQFDHSPWYHPVRQITAALHKGRTKMTRATLGGVLQEDINRLCHTIVRSPDESREVINRHILAEATLTDDEIRGQKQQEVLF